MTRFTSPTFPWVRKTSKFVQVVRVFTRPFERLYVAASFVATFLFAKNVRLGPFVYNPQNKHLRIVGPGPILVSVDSSCIVAAQEISLLSNYTQRREDGHLKGVHNNPPFFYTDGTPGVLDSTPDAAPLLSGEGVSNFAAAIDDKPVCDICQKDA